MHQKLFGKDIILYARTIAPTLAKKERLVVSFIENSTNDILKMNISDIANFLKVSEACITKVAKKMGFKGFHELKRQLILCDYVEDYHFIQNSKQAANYKEILENTFLNSILSIQEALSVLDLESFNKAAEVLSNFTKNNKLVMAGCGGSSVICQDFHHKLLKIGIFSNSYFDSHLQLMSASLLGKGDIALGISHSGKTQDVINMLALAKENGASTICITGVLNSPITKIANISIITPVKNNPITGENGATRIVHLNIIDALFVILANRKNNESKINLQKTQAAVLFKRV